MMKEWPKNPFTKLSINIFCIVTLSLKARTVVPEEMATAKQQLGKHIPVPMDMYKTIQELLGSSVFYVVHAKAI